MTPVHVRRAVTALLVVIMSAAYVNARAEGLRPGHVCPMAADHGAGGGHDVEGAHDGHHDTPAPEHGGQECQCEDAGCCPAGVSGLPSAAPRSVPSVPAPGTILVDGVAALVPDLPLRGAPAARAPPIQL